MSCKGFRFAGVAAGVKKKAGALDLGIIACDPAASAAAIFTSNRVKAAPVVVSKAALAKSGGRVSAVVVNSGNANACTGPRGTADARRMVSATAAALGVPAGEVVVSSTGVIGVPLPIERIEDGIARARPRAGAFAAFAQAILTTDRAAKTARRTAKLAGGRATIIGCTKGAGMIAPNMATTLTFVCTDAGIAPTALHDLLRAAADDTFNAMTVDGDTSTNDMILVLASGAGPAVKRADRAAFAGALHAVLDDLAHQLMAGGEGVHHVVEIRVCGARTVRAARQVARAIANSPLVKTAIAGRDPNWGRFLSAAGNAGVPLVPGRLALWLGDVPIARDGRAADTPDVEAEARRVMAAPRYTVTLDLGAGRETARYLACDLSHEYVTINADYRT